MHLEVADEVGPHLLLGRGGGVAPEPFREGSPVVPDARSCSRRARRRRRGRAAEPWSPRRVARCPSSSPLVRLPRRPSQVPGRMWPRPMRTIISSSPFASVRSPPSARSHGPPVPNLSSTQPNPRQRRRQQTATATGGHTRTEARTTMSTTWRIMASIIRADQDAAEESSSPYAAFSCRRSGRRLRPLAAPHRLSTVPFLTPVGTPSLSVTAPFTTTCPCRSASRFGSNVVPRSPKPRRIEDRDVGACALAHDAAAAEAEPLRRLAGQPVHGLRRREQVLARWTMKR